MYFIKIAIFYTSYLVFPFLTACAYFLLKSKLLFVRFFSLILILISLVFIYSRFIETRVISVQKHTFENDIKAKFALISDTHLGIYKGSNFLQKTVDKINAEGDLDFVLIAGDLTYEPNKNRLTEIFAP